MSFVCWYVTFKFEFSVFCFSFSCLILSAVFLSFKDDKRIAVLGLAASAFDNAATQIVDQMEFSPAMNRDKPVGVWVAQRIDFTVNG